MNLEDHARIFVAGGAGLLGSAVRARLTAGGHDRVTAPRSSELDLTDQSAVRSFFQANEFDAVLLAAGRVGGIRANDTQPASFLHDNITIAGNVIHEAWSAGVPRLLYVGSACIYPKHAAQPIREDALLSGELEPTNRAYAVAKIAGIELCAAIGRQHGVRYRSAMLTNLYGPGDNFHPTESHVIPGLVRKMHEAKCAGAEEVVVWGTGVPTRDFLYVHDAAAACVHLLGVSDDVYEDATGGLVRHINVGSGEEISIRDLAETVREVVGFEGALAFDDSKPDGVPRRVLDVSHITGLGWSPAVSLREGLSRTYAWFMERGAEVRGMPDRAAPPSS